MEAQQAIGLFDSGVGGLTVAHALHSLLPEEQLIYYGDTAHLPYGDKSKETIIGYSLEIADFLLARGCKLILIACNSASSNALEAVKNHVGERAMVMNVIDPVAGHVLSQAETIRSVGVIGTKATIRSGAYERRLLSPVGDDGKPAAQAVSKLQVSSLATPLFVPMIEEGFVFDDISNAIIRAYLSRPELEDIDTLVLGCTHYPIIRNQISRFFNFEVNVLDTALIVAQSVKAFLQDKNLLSAGRQAADRFFVSDHTPYFEVIANMFFNEKIQLEKV
ncbi:MAG: glutamate racemase [Bacteroidetes bacterium]|nr:MAG: glutamate racemase [Bacteroidota bacterium]